MDKCLEYRRHICNILTEYSTIRVSNGDIENQLIFDGKADRYLLLHVGWLGAQRIDSIVFHLDIIAGKIWIQSNNTELVLKDELMSLGVPEQDIVIGLQPPSVRQLLALEEIS